MPAKNSPHPAVEYVLDGTLDPQPSNATARLGEEHTTSLSLARALAIGCISRLRSTTEHVNIWDPAAGVGFAGALLVEALRRAGVRSRYRGQDINVEAVAESAQ